MCEREREQMVMSFPCKKKTVRECVLVVNIEEVLQSLKEKDAYTSKYSLWTIPNNQKDSQTFKSPAIHKKTLKENRKCDKA